MVHNVDVSQLMYPPAPSQPSTLYKDPPVHSPYTCNRIPFLFKALMCALEWDLSYNVCCEFTSTCCCSLKSMLITAVLRMLPMSTAQSYGILYLHLRLQQ